MPDQTFAQSTRFEAVLDYLQREFSIIPVGDDKKPLIVWKESQNRRADEAELRAWWTKWPGGNIGIVCGKISNLTVVDCDSDEAIAKVEATLPDSFLCPIVLTPRGGRHYWFRYTSDLKTGNGILPGLDVKNDGSYVIAPPSLTRRGVYEWIVPATDRDRAPQDLIALLVPSAEVALLPVYDSTPDPALAKLKELDLRRHLTHFEGLVFDYKGLCLCPVHGEKVPSFEVKLHTDGHWYWFDWHNQGRAGFSGTIIDYYVTIKGFTIAEAIKKIKGLEGIQETTIDPALKPPTASSERTATPNTPAKREKTIELIARPLSDVTSRETFYLMQDRIPMGMFTLIVGGGGGGKSTFLTEVACRVSRGEPLPGATKALIPAGSVIYITAENQPEEVFRPRAIACRGDLKKIIYIRNVLVSVDSRPDELHILDIGQHLSALSKYQADLGDVRAVIVDPIISHVNERIDDSRAKPVRQLLDSLSDFAEREKIALIGVIHVAKGTASSAQAKAAGSHQWVDASRVALGIAKDKDDPDGKRRFLSMLKSNIYVNWKTLAFNIIDTPVHDEASPDLSLRAGRVEFEAEEVDIDVEALFNPDRLTESMTTKAIRLFNNELKNGPRPADEIWALAESMGISEGPYKYARKKRNIHAEKIGGRFGSDSKEEKWVLWLPEHWDASQATKSRKKC